MRGKDMELHGRPIVCEDCGGSLATLVRIGVDRYRHKDLRCCDTQRRRDARAKKTKSGLHLP